MQPGRYRRKEESGEDCCAVTAVSEQESVPKTLIRICPRSEPEESFREGTSRHASVQSWTLKSQNEVGSERLMRLLMQLNDAHRARKEIIEVKNPNSSKKF